MLKNGFYVQFVFDLHALKKSVKWFSLNPIFISISLQIFSWKFPPLLVWLAPLATRARYFQSSCSVAIPGYDWGHFFSII